MPLTLNKLTAVGIARLKTGGYYSDGADLLLQIPLGRQELAIPLQEWASDGKWDLAPCRSPPPPPRGLAGAVFGWTGVDGKNAVSPYETGEKKAPFREPSF